MCSVFTEQPVNRLSTFRLHSFRWIHRLAFISELDSAVNVFGKSSELRAEGSGGGYRFEMTPVYKAIFVLIYIYVF